MLPEGMDAITPLPKASAYFPLPSVRLTQAPLVEKLGSGFGTNENPSRSYGLARRLIARRHQRRRVGLGKGCQFQHERGVWGTPGAAKSARRVHRGGAAALCGHW